MELLAPIINNIQTGFNASSNFIPVYFYLQQEYVEGMTVTARIVIPSIGSIKEISYEIEEALSITDFISLQNETTYCIKIDNTTDKYEFFQLSLCLNYRYTDEEGKDKTETSAFSPVYLFQSTTLTEIAIDTPNKSQNGQILPQQNVTFYITPSGEVKEEETDYIEYCVFSIDEGKTWTNKIYSDETGKVTQTYTNEFVEKYNFETNLQVIYKTHKGYLGKDSSFTINTISVPIEDKNSIKEMVIQPFEEGAYNTINIKLSFALFVPFFVYRSKHSENKWELIYKVNDIQSLAKYINLVSLDEYLLMDINEQLLVLGTETEIEVSFIDKTVEFGVSYDYKAILEYEINGQFYQAKKTVNSIANYFEDAFLIDKHASLKIKYNPDISGLKYNIIETVTPTLGSPYPYVRRVGKQKYRTFTISGLISYHMDEYENFSYGTDSLKSGTSIINNYLNPSFIMDINNIENKGLRERMLERHYREKVLEFLHADNIKLFKAEPEGNILVRLSNILLTSNKQLGRIIYSFSATATEIAETTVANCEKYGIVNINESVSNNFIYNDYVLYIDEDNAIVTTEEDALTLEQIQYII